jgi:hypothetical protein
MGLIGPISTSQGQFLTLTGMGFEIYTMRDFRQMFFKSNNTDIELLRLSTSLCVLGHTKPISIGK